MRVTELDTFSRTQRLLDVNATVRLAGALSEHVRQGDVICITGALGAGKTTFARAFINAIAQRVNCSEEEVPSPTFTLLQTYEAKETIIYHFDLYRIEKPNDAIELGIEEAFADGLTLIEWGERLGSLLPTNRLDVNLFPGKSTNARQVKLRGHGDWKIRLDEGFNQGSNHD